MLSDGRLRRRVRQSGNQREIRGWRPPGARQRGLRTVESRHTTRGNRTRGVAVLTKGAMRHLGVRAPTSGGGQGKAAVAQPIFTERDGGGWPGGPSSSMRLVAEAQGVFVDPPLAASLAALALIGGMEERCLHRDGHSS